MKLRVLTIGDIVGPPGLKLLSRKLVDFIAEHEIDVTIANAENSVAGSGVNPSVVKQLLALGVDVITTGDHVWRRKEIIPVLEKDRRIIRPANFKDDAPGRGWTVVTSRNGVDVGVVQVLGRVFMPPVECPFDAVDKALREVRPRTKIIFVEFHAEATSEKVAMGYFLDGRVSAVYGTHTHVPTADIKILEEGTAYITDIGMTGPHFSVLGLSLIHI